MNDESPKSQGVTRRGMLTGVSAAVLAGSIAGAKPGAARAAPLETAGSDGVGPPLSAIHPHTSPVTTSIASPPLPNRIYRSVGMYDFSPFDPAAGRTWGGYGTFAGGTSTTMRATVDIPPGALIREVEYYVYNNSGSNFIPDCHVWVPGHGSIASIGATVSIPSTAATISATQATVSQQGPYPLGSELHISMATPSTGTIQINGARVAFSQGGGTVGLLRDPVRAYDSRVGHHKLAAGHARTITLPATLALPGVMAVLADITVLNPVGRGWLKAYRGDLTPPKQATLYYNAAPATTQVAIEVSTSGQIQVLSSKSTDVVIDIIGTIS
jgi:hypothetical protein